MKPYMAVTTPEMRRRRFVVDMVQGGLALALGIACLFVAAGVLG